MDEDRDYVESTPMFDDSDPVGYLWDLAEEAIDFGVTKYPNVSTVTGMEKTTKWLNENCDESVSIHPYRLVHVADKEWSRHKHTYEMGILTAYALQ